MSMDQKSVNAEFYYRIPLKDGEGKPSFGKNPIDPTVVRHQPYLKGVTNARNMETTLDAEGFILAEHESEVEDFYDTSEVEEKYYPEIRELARQITHAKAFRILGHITRNEAEAEEGKRLGAHRLVHNDFTPSLLDKIQDFVKDPDRLQGRIAIFNVWRRFDPGLSHAPLAVCDSRSISKTDLLPTDLHNYGGRTEFQLEIYQSLNSEEHRWFYYPEMLRNEVLVFRTFDTDMDPFVPTLHSAFDHPDCPKTAPARESIETRVLCFY
ncbi:MAG: CmcJ/NvfI family oxidoreductase [Myxococcota bacterium]|nr:CmcJ/NvfI family oxidoreductase [Myxococcota bacterium]